MNTANQPITFSKPLRRNKAIARLAVKEYEHRLRSLASIHLCSSNWLDWAAIRQQHPPKSPVRSFKNEQDAFMNLVSYEPAFLIKTLKLTESRKKHLEKKVEIARQMDETLYAVAVRKYTAALTSWQLWQLMSVGVLDGNIEVYRQVLDFLKPLDGLEKIGVKPVLHLYRDQISVELHLPGAAMVPKYALSLNDSGKLSRHMLPDSRANELYFNLVCGVIVRAARELAACLPVSQIHVRALSDMPDIAAGGTALHTIVSVELAASQLFTDKVDAYALILASPHKMCYSRTHGFSPVKVVS